MAEKVDVDELGADVSAGDFGALDPAAPERRGGVLSLLTSQRQREGRPADDQAD